MDLETLRNYCLSLKATTEDLPFDESTLVFRVGGKIFLLTDTIDYPFHFNLKALPEDVIELQEQYDCIKPGYHMNKTHWVTVTPDGSLPDSFFYKIIENSYNLIFKSLKKADRMRIEQLK